MRAVTAWSREELKRSRHSCSESGRLRLAREFWRPKSEADKRRASDETYGIGEREIDGKRG